MRETNVKNRVEDARRGDTEALAFLFQLYRPQLYSNALRLVGNTPMAQDAMQDTFLLAFTNIRSLRDESVFYPWLKKILVNTCFLALRKEKSARNYLFSIPNDAFIEESIEQRFETIESNHSIYSALNRLSPELRSCVMLRYFSSFESYDEIALILGIPIGTVRSRLAAAREKLSNVLPRFSDESDRAFAEARQWSAYYHEIWTSFYDDPQAREEFINHLDPALNVRFTSGNTGTGKGILVEEFNNDLLYGSRLNVTNVSSSGNISILEGINTNSPEYPDRCAPSSIIIMFRKEQKIVDCCHIFDSPRSI